MWFRRKRKNRRLEREQVLDVKLRSSQVRAARSRIFAVTLGVLFVAGFGVYMARRISSWALDRLVYENRAFALQESDVQTDGVVSADQIRRWAGVKLEENLLALDLARVKRDLELVPVVESASVERVLPRTLRIRIVEREPVAQINLLRPRQNLGAELVVCQVDAGGWVMLPLEPHQRAIPPGQSVDQFPVLAGLDATSVQPGRRIEAPQVHAALQLILAFEHSPMASMVDLKRLDVSSPDVLVATTGQGSEVTFALTDIDQQLRRWHQIHIHAQKSSKAIATLDLAVTNNIPARWLEASAAPPSVPRLPKPSRNRKRHV